MEILECWLKNYGKFSDYRIAFHAGLNVVEGGNESGKSTVFSFIRAMLYGLPKNRSKNIDEYQIRQPWENPDHFAGAMKVHYEDRIYRIERNFLKKDERLTVVCETEGREVEDPETFLFRLTGGLSETDFLNTFYIRQAQAQTEAQLGADLRDFLVNTEQSGSARTDVSAAMDILKKRKKELEAERRRKLEDLEARTEENRRQTEYVRGEIGRLGTRLEEDAAAPEEENFTRRSAASSAGSNETAAREGSAESAGTDSTEGSGAGSTEASETGRTEGSGAGNTEASETDRTEGSGAGNTEALRPGHDYEGKKPGHVHERERSGHGGRKETDREEDGYPGDGEPEDEDLKDREPEDEKQADEPQNRLTGVLAVLFILAGILALVCGFFAFSGRMQITLYVLGAIFLAAGVLTPRLSQGGRQYRKQDLFGDYEDSEPEAEEDAGEPDEQEDEEAGGRSRCRLKRAERSVERYSRLNHLFGFRDDSVDPDLEAKKRRLEVQRAKAMQEEEVQVRQQTAADVNRILKAEKESSEEKTAPGRGTGAENSGLPGKAGTPEKGTGAESRFRKAGRTDALSRELREKQLHLAQLQDAFGKLAEEKEKLLGDDEDLRALDLAMERISMLSDRIYHETGEQFAARVSEILSRLTEGRYRSISMNEKMEVVINTPDRLLKMQQVSFGTMNQIYFALRIASGELLSGGADLPLLLDEPFAMYDDGRLKEALRFLAGYGRQIILFTCQGREKVLAREI